jgi:carbon-monoxide dehydrogenase small subunit
MLDSCDVRTVEGFENDPIMTKLRDAFHQEHALQCGFCTSGMLITARDIVTRFAEIDEIRIRKELAGNICRCTGYVGIVNAIQRVLSEVAALDRVGKTWHGPSTRRPGAEAAVKAPPATGIAAAPLPIDVGTVDPTWSRIESGVTVSRPPGEVWALLSDVRRVARCIPGAEIVRTDGRLIDGRLRVVFGPIKTNFAGTAVLTKDDAAMSGELLGSGGDDVGHSRARGRLQYKLLPLADGTSRIDLIMDYKLQGPFAQFGRSGLIRDFVTRLMAMFAKNLAAGIDAGSVEQMESAGALSTTSILLSILKDRLARLFGFKQ